MSLPPSLAQLCPISTSRLLPNLKCPLTTLVRGLSQGLVGPPPPSCHHGDIQVSSGDSFFPSLTPSTDHYFLLHSTIPCWYFLITLAVLDLASVRQNILFLWDFFFFLRFLLGFPPYNLCILTAVGFHKIQSVTHNSYVLVSLIRLWGWALWLSQKALQQMQIINTSSF